VEKVGVGVIGLGMGRNHAIQFRDCPEAELIALCDVNAERAAQVANETHPRRVYTSTEKLLADPEIAAVAVALPNALHAPVVLECFAAGKHVLCEKPLAMNAREGEQMVEAARRAGRRLMMHFNYRFQPTSQAVKRAVDAGALGPVYFARSVWHRKRGVPGLGGWFTQKTMSGGGGLIDLGVHRLDLALWLMGYPRPVSVTGTAYSILGRRLAERAGKSFDVDDLAAGFIRFENGASLVLEASWASNSEKREDQLTQLFGVEGGAVLRNWDEGYQYEARLFRDVEGEVVTEVPEPPAEFESPQRHFCRSIVRGTEPTATGEQGLTVMRILDAIYESAETGLEVRLQA
jgi:predicted dehydrogenase